MRIRVTSVNSEDTGPLLREVTVKLEDWLTAALSDGEYSSAPDQLAFVIVSAFDEPEENERWARSHDKLGSYKDLVAGAG